MFNHAFKICSYHYLIQYKKYRFLHPFSFMLLQRSVQIRPFLKSLHLQLKHSFLQSQELISTSAKRTLTLLAITGTNKRFKNSNHISLEIVNIVMRDMNVIGP